MTAENIIVTIRNELIRSISGLDAWFDKEAMLMDHKPGSGDWCVREVLEHVMLTNRFLLNFIDQGTDKASRQSIAGDFRDFIQDYRLENQALTEVGIHTLFDSTIPIDMGPTGKVSLSEVRREIREQLDRCLIHLELLRNGEGILCKTKMSVSGLGQLDVYQNMYFLAHHVKRSVHQLEKIQEDFDNAFEKA